MKFKLFQCLLGLLRNAHRHSREPPPQPLAPEIPKWASSDKADGHLAGDSLPAPPVAQLYITRTSDSLNGGNQRSQNSSDVQQTQRTLTKPTPTVSIPSDAQGSSNDHLSPGEFSTRSSRGKSISSNRSSSRESSCSKNSAAGDSLSARLRRARVDCHQRLHCFIVPISDQESLITVDNVEEDILAGDRRIGPDEIKRVAGRACDVAPKLYAILAYLKSGHEISRFLEDGVSDQDLPFKRERVKDGPVLRRKSGGVIRTFENWKDEDIESFDLIQWWMISPVFENQAHHELEDGTVLPFIAFETNLDTAEKIVGGYSEVYFARIHPSHHNFWVRTGPQDEEPLVAVKRLMFAKKADFEKEVNMLKALGSREEKHPHLITLLATFKHKRKYHLVFPFANANLRKYWKDRPFPNFDRETVLWSLKQMAGIADALEALHNCSVKYRPSTNGTRGRDKPELLFGRHGDIRPENILWFQKIPGIEDAKGVLQLADFGLGRFHGRDSRSKVPWQEVVAGSPAYTPPECLLHRPISRTYDIWSLGCLYLEFITWLLKGSEAIDEFSRARCKIDTAGGIEGSNFFLIINDGRNAIVKKEVMDWTQQLHEHEKCSALVHDLLDLVTSEVLVPDSKKRISAKRLHQRLSECLQKASGSDDYLLKPAPGRPQLSNSQRFQRGSSIGSITRSKKDAAFPMSHEAPRNVSAANSRPPRDLVGRGAGTPGLLRRSKTDETWLHMGTAKG